MKPCKHLDYNEATYPGCTIVELEGFSCPVKHWRRDMEIELESGNPVNVQFCKLRGRINDIFSCYNIGERSCHETDQEQSS